MTNPVPAALVSLTYLITLVAVGAMTVGTTFSSVLGFVFFVSVPWLVYFNVCVAKRSIAKRRLTRLAAVPKLDVDLTEFGGGTSRLVLSNLTDT